MGRFHRSIARALVASLFLRAVVSCSGADLAPRADTGSSNPAAVVARVVVAPSPVSLSVGAKSSLAASAFDADGKAITGRTVSWSTSDTHVVTVDAQGSVTAMGRGQADITATIDGVTGSAHASVAAVVTSVTVTVQPSVIDSAGSGQATAVLRDASGAAVSGEEVTWRTSNSAVATVSTTGVVTGNRSGVAEIEAVWHPTAESVSGKASISVRSASALAVSSNTVTFASQLGEAAPRPIDVTVTSGTSAGTGLTATIAYSSGSGWLAASLDQPQTPALLTMTANPSGLSAGSYSATVTLAATGTTSKAIAVTLTVSSPRPVSTVAVSLNASTLLVGAKTQAGAILRDDAGATVSGRAITWSSGNSSVATVDNTGLVTGVAAGSTTIIATSEGKTGNSTVEVVSPSTGNAGSITKTQGDGLTVMATRQVAPGPRVVVRNAAGQPLSGVPVTFAVTSGGGIISGPSTPVTNSSGLADVNWYVGPLAGPNTLTATVSGLPPVTFTATAFTAVVLNMRGYTIPVRGRLTVRAEPTPSPYKIVSITGSAAGRSVSLVDTPSCLCWVGVLDLSGLPAGDYTVTTEGVDSVGTRGSESRVFTALEPVASVTVALGASSISVNATTQATATAKDRNGTTITPGSPIAWSSSNTTVATVDANGVVTGRAAGSATITGTADGVPGSAPVTVTSASPPASITKTQGDGLTVMATRQVAPGPTVAVRNAAGQPLPGVPVTFAVTSGGGTISGPSTVVTNANGLADVNWYVGPLAGPNTLTATVSGLPPVTFTATAFTAVVLNMRGYTIPVRGRLTVRAEPTPSPYKIVSITGSAAGRSVSLVDTPSCLCWVGILDLSGLAAGDYTVTTEGVDSVGTRGSESRVFTALEPVASVTVALGTSSLGVNATTQATATAKDRNGTTITPGNPIAWSSSNTAVATVDANGVVTGRGAGNATITATADGVPGSAPVTVTSASPPASITKTQGDGLTIVATRQLTPGPTVVVRNAAGQPLPGVSVAFAVTSGGGTISGPSTVVTNDNGLADVNWYVGPLAGPNTLTATVSGLPPVTFTATATVTVSIRANFPNGATTSARGILIARAFTGQTPYRVFSVTMSGAGRTGTLAQVPPFGGTCPPDQCWSGEMDISGVPAGQYTLTVEGVDSVGTRGSTTLTFTALEPVTSVTVAFGSSPLGINATTQATATAKDRNGTTVAPGRVTWSSSNNAVATVDANGIVTGRGAGTANITATADGVPGSATITVTASTPP